MCSTKVSLYDSSVDNHFKNRPCTRSHLVVQKHELNARFRFVSADSCLRVRTPPNIYRQKTIASYIGSLLGQGGDNYLSFDRQICSISVLSQTCSSCLTAAKYNSLTCVSTFHLLHQISFEEAE